MWFNDKCENWVKNRLACLIKSSKQQYHYSGRHNKEGNLPFLFPDYKTNLFAE